MKKSPDFNGMLYEMNVRSWFVHFSTWTPPDEVNVALRSGDTIRVDYDDYDHYWNVKEYIPSEQQVQKPKVGTFKIVKKSDTKTGNRFACLEVGGQEPAGVDDAAATSTSYSDVVARTMETGE